MSSVAYEWQKQLLELGGPHKRSVVIDNALEHLRKVSPRRWYSHQAPGRLLRFLQLRQKPNDQEISDLRIAHARITPKLMVAKSAENQELAASLRTFIETALRADPEFYSAEIEAAREIACALGHLVDRARPDDGAH